MNDEQLLHAWIERAAALRARDDAELTTEQIEAIALELGISRGDLDRLEDAMAAQCKRGEGYLEHGLWAQALDELSSVAALSPNVAGLQLQLASAHRGLWRETGDLTHREAAERHAQRSLEIDPDRKEPYALIRSLDAGGGGRWSWLTPGRVGAFAVAVAFLVGWTANDLLTPAPPPINPLAALESEPALPTLEDPMAGFGERVTRAIAAPKAEVPAGASETEPGVTLVASDAAPGLRLEVRKSLLNNYEDSSFYKLHALLHAEGDVEIDELKLEMKLLDADGAVLDSRSVDAIQSHEPVVRPGDANFFDVLERTTPAVRAVELTVLRAETAPAASRYGDARPLAARWAESRPDHIDVAVRERHADAKSTMFSDDELHFDAVFEIENTGDGPIRNLKLRLLYLDGAGEQVADSEKWIASSAGDTLYAGESRVIREIESVPNSYADYRVELFDLE